MSNYTLRPTFDPAAVPAVAYTVPTSSAAALCC